MKRISMTLLATATGGMLGGMLLGLVETISLSLFTGWAGFAALLWSITTYGTLGLLGGLGLGLAGSLLLGRWLPRHLNWWLLISGALVFSGAGLIVMRYRMLRDLFQDRASLTSPEGLTLHLVLLAGFGGIVIAAVLIGRRWTARTSPPSSPLAATTTASTEDDLSRRTFLKASLAAGVVALPVAGGLSQMLDRRAAFANIQLSNRVRDQLKGKPNVIVIAADTLRADHLGVYGYNKAVTPHLDEFAAHSTQFVNMFAQAAWTKPSMTTLFTSLYPSSHNTLYKTSALPKSVITFPSILQAQGYITGGFANNVNIAPYFNFNQGFTDYEFLEPDYLLGATDASSQFTVYQTMRMVNERFLQSRKNVHNFYQPAEVVTQRAIEWLTARQDERFCLFLHYMDPHDPFFEHPFNNYGIARVSTPNPSPDMAPDMIKLYDQEITYMDQHLGELFNWLKQMGLYDETIIAFTADHGEEFYEHGGWWHGLTLYDEQIHVPLLVKMAGQTEHIVDTDLARTLDIGPTLIRAAGFDVPEVMQGIDLYSEPANRPKFVYSEEDHEGNILRAGRNTTWKLMEANAGNPRGLATTSFFNLAEDPGQIENIAAQEPEKVALASNRIAQVAEWAKSKAVGASEVELDEARKNALEKTGYGR